MSIRLNATKRSKIMNLIRNFLTDKETQEAYYNAIVALMPFIKENIEEKFPQSDMEILSKYDMVDFGWTTNIHFQLHEDGKQYPTTYYEEFGNIIDLPIMIPHGRSFTFDGTSFKEEIENYSKAKAAYRNTIRELDRKYDQFVGAAYSIEAVIEIIPWLQNYYGYIAKETSCKVSEEAVKDILAIENKRNAA